jgi:hypothetical protein
LGFSFCTNAGDGVPVPDRGRSSCSFAYFHWRGCMYPTIFFIFLPWDFAVVVVRTLVSRSHQNIWEGSLSKSRVRVFFFLFRV